MNLKDIYTYFPDHTRLLQINMEFHSIQDVFPEMRHENIPAVCIYGISEEEAQTHLESYEPDFERITQKIKEALSPDELWDVQIKPILLFDTRKTAVFFCDFANSLDYESFCELIDEMQQKYNVPWKSAKLIDEKTAGEIVKSYSRQFS